MGSSREDRGLKDLVEAFRKVYHGTSPTHFSRAPGRVNLIGEHTDYNGLPVLPMALRQEIRILFSPRTDTTVRVANTEAEFEAREFTMATLIPAEPVGDWGNYLKAPCQALARWSCGVVHGGRSLANEPDQLRGFDALVSSTLPVASGLSSSSALVIAIGRTLLASNGLEMDTLEFAEAMAQGERYTGTQGGGMDQAISAGAREGHASRIEFGPLRMHETPVPEEWRFIVAHTLVRAEKSGPAQEAYNNRTRECKAALDGLLPALKARGMIEDGPVSYRQLLDQVCIQDLVDLGEEQLEGILLKRFRHVVTEGTRVYDAEQALGREDLLTFGLLMDASHESLRYDYEVSSPALDHLVEIAREAGAAGARLTGAGFGGCMVALAHTDRVTGILGALEEGYYREKGLTKPLDQVLFVAEASGGASVEEV